MSQERLTSLSLIEGLRKNDQSYWGRLNTLYGPIVQNWIRRAGIPTSNVDDICQDVLLAVARNIDQYKHSVERSGSMRRWMWGIARHKIADFWERASRQAGGEGGTGALKRLQTLPDAPFEDSDPKLLTAMKKALIGRALAILETDFEARTWQAFWKAVVDELPTAEVAEILQMSPASVRQAKYRVLQRLREELGSELDD